MGAPLLHLHVSDRFQTMALPPPCGMRMHTIYRYDLATCKLTTVCKMGRTRFQGRRERRCKNLYTFDVKPYTESLVRIRITPPWK